MAPWMEWSIIAGRVLFVGVLPLLFIPLLVWAERKASAFIQDRTGPNRAAILGVRMGGIIHTLSDVVKLVFKEDIVPSQARRFYFTLAPFLAMAFALMTFAVIPFADTLRAGGNEIPMQALRINPGLLWIFAIGSFGVFGIVFAGWGANSKYPLLGGIRSSAQLISYELSLGLSVAGILLIFGTVDLNRIVQGQGELLFGFLPMWGVVVQPLAAVLFIAASLAETNRNPFDLPEAESEIVGFHLEYSSLKFALFMMTEYVHIVVVSALITTLFFGGWQVPWMPTEKLIANIQPAMLIFLASLALVALVLLPVVRRWNRYLRRLYVDARRHEADFWTAVLLLLLLGAAGGAALILANPPTGDAAAGLAAFLQVATFLGKVTFFGFFFIWVRWTLPRFRYDQLMGLGWKAMLPLGLLNVVVTAAAVLLLER